MIPLTTGPRARETVAGALLGLVVLLLFRRYLGIYHDSMLYLGQGLERRWPGIFSQDLFFVHGSQTDYSLFPWALGQALRFWRAPDVFLWATLCSLALFAAASWYCLRVLLPRDQRYWAWLGILALPAMYGVVSIFSFNEKFLTSRPISESLCLVAIGLSARKQSLAAIAVLVLAALAHPLQAIAAGLVIWIWAISRNRAWLHLLWAALPVATLGMLGIAPFKGLFERADPVWLAAIRESTHLFVSLWDTNSLKSLGFDVFLLALGWRLVQGPFGAWCRAALWALLLGVTASLLLVDVLGLTLPISLQLWRVQWVGHWFALAALAGLLFQGVVARDWGRVLVLALTAQLAWGETVAGWLAMALLYLAWPYLLAGSRDRLAPVLTWLFAAMLAFLLYSHASNELRWFGEEGYRLDAYAFDLRLLAFPALALGLPVLATILWRRSASPARAVLFCFALVPALTWSALSWDGRVEKNRQLEAAAHRPALFGFELPLHAQVYWAPEELLGSWLVLQRRNYFSQSQLAGQMFNRDTFSAGRIRSARMLPLSLEVQQCIEETRATGEHPECPISESSLLQACGVGPVPPPDFLVLIHPQPRFPLLGSWDMIDTRTGSAALTYRLYSCSDIIRVLSARGDADRH